MNNQDTRFANQYAIQWFPGHMAKTLRMMEQEIQHVDASLVLLDARIPLSSLNPEIERITARKPKLYALNKADLADPAVTEEWIKYFRAADAGCVAISAKQKGGANAVKVAIEKELSGLLERRQNRGMGGAKTQVMLCGIPNVGKSTFIKILMGEQKPDSGTIDIGETVRFGYYSQDGLRFDEQMKVIDVVQDIAEVIELGNGKRLTASQFLQHFLFTPETQHSYVYKLSGGERRRLYLCTVLMRNPNFLVLDEPTNDLDIITLQVLEEYLQNFKGCVIVVSHDRYFMDKVVDHLLVFKGQGDIRDFPGNYSDYRDWREVKEQREKEAEKPKEEKTARVRLNDKRRMTFKERKEYERLEKEIGELEQEKADIESALCSGTLSVEELTEKSKRLPELNDLIDEKSMRWLELSEIEG